MCGTPCYASPQIEKNEPYSTKSDCWSLGVLAYEIINGKLSEEYFEGNPLVYENLKFDGNVSSGYRDMMRQLLKIEENERISIEDFLNLPCF